MFDHRFPLKACGHLIPTGMLILNKKAISKPIMIERHNIIDISENGRK